MLKIHDLVGKIFNNQDLAIKICHQDLPSNSCWQNWDIQDLAGKIQKIQNLVDKMCKIQDLAGKIWNVQITSGKIWKIQDLETHTS